MKECVRDESLQLPSYYLTELIKATRDIEYVKECVRDTNLSSAFRSRLIEDIGGKDYIKACVDDTTLQLEKEDIFRVLLKSNFIQEGVSYLKNLDKDTLIKCIEIARKEYSFNDRMFKKFTDIFEENGVIEFCGIDKLTIIKKLRRICYQKIYRRGN